MSPLLLLLLRINDDNFKVKDRVIKKMGGIIKRNVNQTS